MSAEKARVGGWRQAIMLLHKVAEIAEQHPDLPAPRMSFNNYEGDHITYSVYESPDYSVDRANREGSRRQRIEAKFNLLTRMWGDELEWVTNSPLPADDNPHTRTFHREYFVLSTVVSGAEIKLLTTREHIGEKVQSLDSGPVLDELYDGTMQAVRTSVTTWQPNIHLTALARPGYAIASTTSKELSA